MIVHDGNLSHTYFSCFANAGDLFGCSSAEVIMDKTFTVITISVSSSIVDS